ncbi:hypothetical protein AA313_de0200585 [Arthrobotrys entomopaga]|nr:hypothetical protein AA313_de0200585 [Arthrobotrys entomopaga]
MLSLQNITSHQLFCARGWPVEIYYYYLYCLCFCSPVHRPGYKKQLPSIIKYHITIHFYNMMHSCNFQFVERERRRIIVRVLRFLILVDFWGGSCTPRRVR